LGKGTRQIIKYLKQTLYFFPLLTYLITWISENEDFWEPQKYYALIAEDLYPKLLLK
jgi:hypothetical protein